ncbi:MAG: transglycosylase SLT domain-containing protein, partial [Bacteroidaceae bacterium]|nr:transglycosylase SLT domain-containing protein [Bacteroidaceae bacterium]
CSAEVFQDRLSRIPAVMEMPYNGVVQKFIDQYSGRLRRSVSYMLGAGNFYIPIFEEALDYYGLPLELKYLPIIESGLNPTAVSRVGATGLWQFMLATGKRYDLQVNSLVDERRDPIKSSWAAARDLRDLYKIFGDWNLVIAAYNCGPQNVNKAIHRADGVKDYWAIYPYLPKETRGYVPAFIAANYIMNYYCEHNICPMKTKYPVTTDTIVVAKDIHIEQISALCGIDKEAIRALNPQYRTDIIPGHSKPCAIRLPQEKLTTFIDLKDSIYNYRAEELLTRRKTVDVDEAAAETVKRSARSTSRSRQAQASKRRSKKQRGASQSATVRSGDTLSAIAKRNHTTVSKLRKMNGLKGDRINPGQKLKVK